MNTMPTEGRFVAVWEYDDEIYAGTLTWRAGALYYILDDGYHERTTPAGLLRSGSKFQYFVPGTKYEAPLDFVARHIQAAFDNAGDFMERFLPDHDWEELAECYMASERTRIVFINTSGAPITTTIRTSEFINWVASR